MNRFFFTSRNDCFITSKSFLISTVVILVWIYQSSSYLNSDSFGSTTVVKSKHIVDHNELPVTNKESIEVAEIKQIIKEPKEHLEQKDAKSPPLQEVQNTDETSNKERTNSEDNHKNSDNPTIDNEVLLAGQKKRLELIKANIPTILPGPTDYKTLQNLINNEPDNAQLTQVYNDLGEWKYKLYTRLDNIRLHCGKLCQLNTVEEIEKHQVPALPDQILPLTAVPDVDCDSILGLEDIDAGDMTFPSTIPEELENFYSIDGSVIMRIDNYIRKDAYLNGSAEKKLWPTGNVWNKDDINEAIEMVGEKKLAGPYGLQETIDLTETLSEINMKDKSVLVIGSSHPWVEVICLYLGAAKVTTLEYGEIISNHPQIETETPSSIRKKYMEGKLDHFDGIVSHSSVEHSGLGRYGDALNPWGDVLAVARAWCIAKPEAFMWVGVPTGTDRVFYNWHRIYGRIRWPLLAANWRQVGTSSYVEDHDAVFKRGVWLSMANVGFIFEKIDPNNILKD